jgi:hypothetical protein
VSPFVNAPTRFGNFIGEEPEASEEGSEQGDADADNYVYGDNEEVHEDDVGQELMEVDGRFARFPGRTGPYMHLHG